MSIGLLGLVVLALVAGQRFADPALAPRPGDPVVTVQLVDYGYHAALFLPREALLDAASRAGATKLVAVANRFAAYDTLEFGWGDEDFYRSVPTIADLRPGLALSAALGLDTRTVLLVVGHMSPVDASYATGARRSIVRLSERGFDRMIPVLEATLAGGPEPEDLGVGLYGPSLFYRATGHYSLFNVCNHWLARLMLAGGRSVNLTLATLSPLLVWQMRCPFAMPRACRKARNTPMRQSVTQCVAHSPQPARVLYTTPPADEIRRHSVTNSVDRNRHVLQWKGPGSSPPQVWTRRSIAAPMTNASW